MRKLYIYIFLLLACYTTASEITFFEIIENINESTTVKIAESNYSKSILTSELYKHFGDLEVSIQPNLKTQFDNDNIIESNALSMNAGFSFFLGRNNILDEKYINSINALDAAYINAKNTKNQEIYRIYTLYSELWLLQKEVSILELEIDIAKERYNRLLQLYQDGSANILELENSITNLEESEDSLSQNILRQRIVWFSIEQSLGMRKYEAENEIPTLKEFWFDFEISEKPRELQEKYIASDYIWNRQTATISALLGSIKNLEKIDINWILKPFLTKGSHSWTVSYNHENRNLSADYDFPIFSSSNQTTSDSWSTGLSLLLNWGSGKSNSLEAATLMTDLEIQEELLKEVQNNLEFELRSIYQKYIQANNAYIQSEGFLKRQKTLKDAVDTRFNAGQALKSDIKAADILMKRTAWKRDSARIEVQKAYLNLVIKTGEIPFPIKE